MSEIEEQPVSEDDLARMFEEEGQAVDPEPELTEAVEPEAEEPVVVEDVAPEPDLPAAAAPDSEAEPEDTPPSDEQPHLEWATRRNLSTFEEAAKLAYEQERFLGRRASEAKEQRIQIEQLEQALTEARATAPQTPNRSEEWIQQAVVSPDPARYAFELARTGDWASYEQMMETWEGVVGETITVQVHNQIMAAMQGEIEAQGPAQPDNQAAIREAFALSGVYDMVNDPVMAMVKQVADNFGGAHPLVQGAAEGDPLAVQALVEIARSRTLTTRTLRITEPDPARPELAGDGQSPSRTPSGPDPFDGMDEEWRRMGVLPTQE